jgi:hypothetical protein
MKIFVLIPVIVLLLYGCQNPPSELSEERQIAIVNKIKERLEGYHQAVIKKDGEWFREFWANEKDFAVALDGEFITDYDPWFEKDYAQALPEIEEILHFKFGGGKAAIISENAATYATSFDWGMITTASDTIKSTGSIIYVFERTNGKWRCIQAAGRINIIESKCDLWRMYETPYVTIRS